jgi:hypothetical protein
MRRGLLVPLLALALLPPAAIVIARAAGEDTARGFTWIRSAQRPKLQRTEVAGAVLGKDIYVIGGFVPPRRTTSAVERLRRDHWTRTRSLPVALNHAAAVGYRDHVYVAGGYASPDGLGQPVKTLYRYDPKQDRWTRLPDMPTARAALALGASGGQLYAVGGSNGAKQTGVLEIYDIARRRWSRGPSLAVAREHLGGAVYRGRFYAVAGRNNADGNLAIVESYDRATRRWSRLPDMPKERGGNGAAVLGGSLVAVGGEEAGGTIGEVDLFDFASRTWARIAPMPTPRHGLAVVATPSGTVWAVAGGPQPGMAFSNAAELLRPRD